MSPRRGPELPYSVVAGVTPWGSKWVVGSAKMSGATFAPEPPKIYESFNDVLDEKPAFVAIVINVPIGYLDHPSSGVRTCDREVRQLLVGRAMTVHNAPTRALLSGSIQWTEDHLDAASAMLLPSYREVAVEMSPFRQRVVYEGHPELSFYQLNKDTPLRRSKRIEAGRDERRDVLVGRVPGIEKIVDAELPAVPRKHLLDVAALLWSARRVIGHAARRIPEEAEWDSEGLRMEIVY